MYTAPETDQLILRAQTPSDALPPPQAPTPLDALPPPQALIACDALPPPQALTPLMPYLLLVDVDGEGDGAAVIHVVLAGQLGATRHGSRLPRYFLQHVAHRHFSVLLGEANNYAAIKKEFLLTNT